MTDISVPGWWLDKMGFVQGNPFSVKEADTEPLLESCFIDRAYFYDVLGDVDQPRTTFLVADRGCGKSTNRKMLEQQCREKIRGKQVLVVPYLEFGLLLERMVQQPEVVTTRVHVEEILKQAVIALLEKLKDYPDYVQHLHAQGYRRLLKWFLLHYTDILSLEGMDQWLQKVGLLSRNINAQHLFEIAQMRNEKILSDAHTDSVLIEFLVEMINQPSAHLKPTELSPIKLFAKFIDVVSSLGIKATYILVDRVDETVEVAANPSQGAHFLEPLVADLQLMEMPKVAFKFFIPSKIATALSTKPTVRRDRLLFREIAWTVDDLVELLNRRVYVYSEGFLPNLEQLSDDNFPRISQRLAEEAQGLPRNLLLLGEWLLYHYHHHLVSQGQRPIVEQDLQMAIVSFNQNLEIDLTNTDLIQGDMQLVTMSIELSIDDSGAVWRKGKKLDVELTKLEEKILRFCIVNPNRLLSRDELAQAVYEQREENEVPYPSAIDAIVNRLRKKIEPNPKQPQYIKTVRGRGFIFSLEPEMES